jgi:UrcA family protein
MQRHISLLIVAALSAGALAPAAHAAPDVRTVSVRVTSAGLDLASEAGAAVYLKRLARAANEACGGQPDYSPLATSGAKRFEACRGRALSAAVAQSASPLVQRQYAATQDDLRLARK